jgi:hypothetical protein
MFREREAVEAAPRGQFGELLDYAFAELKRLGEPGVNMEIDPLHIFLPALGVSLTGLLQHPR